MDDVVAGFPAELASVAGARRFVRGAVAAWGAAHLEFGAGTVVSEMATNSVIHAHSAFDVRLSFDGETLRIAVSDHSTREPVLKSHSVEATTGRGIQILTAMSESWGVDVRPGGKTVWCTLRIGRDPVIRPLLDGVDGHHAEVDRQVPTADAAGQAEPPHGLAA